MFGTFTTFSTRGDRDRHVGGHAREELQVRIREVDDRVVGDDVLHRRRVHADLAHDALERSPSGKASTLNVTGLPRLDAADVGLVHLGVDLHLRQVLRDREDRRRLQRGGDGLADVDVARDDDAVDRRADHRVVEIGARDRRRRPPSG